MVVPGKRTNGYSYNYFAKPTISDTSFPSTPQVFINLVYPITGFTLYLTAGGPVQYSFNGTDIHGDLNTTTGPATVSFTNRVVSGIFFQVASGSATIRVEAWC